MIERIKARLNELRQEKMMGQNIVKGREEELKNLNEMLMRITGAIQVLEELLREVEE